MNKDDIDEIERLFSENDALDEKIQMELSQINDVMDEYKRVADLGNNIDIYIKKIDTEFSEKTKLTQRDDMFLAVAIGLQILRQSLIKLDFSSKMDDKEAATKIHKENEQANNKFFDDAEKTKKEKKYYASTADILNPCHYVPYDITNGSKKFNLGGNDAGLGSNHRYMVPGHDPIVGLVFGTANILTNTITTWDMNTCHVKSKHDKLGRNMPTIYAQADVVKMFECVEKRFEEERVAIAAALIKQIYHIKSDEKTVKGIPLPFVSKISPKLAETLVEYGLEWANLKQVGKIGIQFCLSRMIDVIIAMLHRLTFENDEEDDIDIFKVRTKKILLISNSMASIINMLYVGYNCYQGNKDAIKRLDIGGIANTVIRLCNDRKFMADIKNEFLINNIDDLIKGEYD